MHERAIRFEGQDMIAAGGDGNDVTRGCGWNVGLEIAVISPNHDAAIVAKGDAMQIAGGKGTTKALNRLKS